MTVYLDDRTQLKRLVARDGAGEADAKARIAAQPYPMEKKVSLSTYPVDNSGTPEELAEKLDGLMSRLKQRSWGQVLIRPFLLACVLAGVSIPVLVLLIPAYS